MMTVYKDTSKGGWIAQIQIGVYDNGRARYKRFKGATKKEATERAEGYLLETKNLAIISSTADLFVKDYIYSYLSTYKTSTLKPSSLTRNYGILKNQITPFIGAYTLNQLTSAIVQTHLINALVAKQYSFSTIHKAYTLLNEALNKAVQEHRIMQNVCINVMLPSKNVFAPKQIEILTAEEIKLFLDIAKSGRFVNGYAIALILYTGLRCGELCALKWSDIDFKAKVMTVQRNISVSYETETDEETGDEESHRVVALQDGTKSQLFRKIPLNDYAIDFLLKMKEVNIRERKSFNNGFRGLTDNDFVVYTRSKVPDVSVISSTYNAMLRYAGIKGRTGVHTLRHTFATNLLSKNIDIKVVSELLGHSSVSFTYNVYIHLTLNQKSDALSTLEY